MRRGHSEESSVRLTIRRTGGFAGLTREWSRVVDPADPDWRELLARLPIDERADAAASRDRFVYLVTCEPPTPEFPYWRCEVPEGDFTGPWRDLLERVQDDGAEVNGEAGTGTGVDLDTEQPPEMRNGPPPMG